MDGKDLDFVPTGHLLRELQTRMDSMVFVGSSNRSSKEDSVLFAVTGALHSCLGLLEAGKLMVLSQGGDDDNDNDNDSIID